MRACPNDGTRLYRVDKDDPLIGAVIDGRFRIDYTLGVGGMGTVYGGVQLSVNRDVAIKVLRTELATREVALERFFREAKTISGLTHPNIVSLIDFGQDRERGLLYLVMELVRGQNLADLLQRGRVRTSLTLEVAYQVCGALTEPHGAGVIHRDLKPDNLLLVPVSDGTVQAKVLDFGIARFMESNTQLTGTGMICGTPAYMAPEQAQNETLDARTDLYALGVIMYEMLSGWPPFSGTSSLQVMLKHIQENPPKLRELLPPATLPSPVEDLVYSLISKERPLRPKDARTVRDAIDEIRRELDLAPVRLEAAGPDTEDIFEPFVLQKLPRPDDQKSGPTQVLRRETGLEDAIREEAEPTPGSTPDVDLEEHRPTSVYKSDTSADEVPVTGPLTPDGRLALMEDARQVKVETREGGQQAWTPSDQVAVRSIKDTKDGVDAHGVTVDAESAELPPRRTMVENNSEEIVDEPPSTDDAIPAVEVHKASPDPTRTSERRPASSSNLPLAIVAILGGVGAIVAAVVVTKKIDEVVSQPAKTVAAAPAEPSEKSKQEQPDTEAIARVVEARVAARGHVRKSLERGSDAAVATDKERKTSPERPERPTVAKKNDRPPRNETKPPPTEDSPQKPTPQEGTSSDRPGGQDPKKAIDDLGLTNDL
jgi:serine/threonine protein kinase